MLPTKIKLHPRRSCNAEWLHSHKSCVVMGYERGHMATSASCGREYRVSWWETIVVLKQHISQLKFLLKTTRLQEKKSKLYGHARAFLEWKGAKQDWEANNTKLTCFILWFIKFCHYIQVPGTKTMSSKYCSSHNYAKWSSLLKQ